MARWSASVTKGSAVSFARPTGTSADNVSGVPFEHLQLGTEVQFIPEVAAQGQQAKRVSIGKHGAG